MQAGIYWMINIVQCVRKVIGGYLEEPRYRESLAVHPGVLEKNKLLLVSKYVYHGFNS